MLRVSSALVALGLLLACRDPTGPHWYRLTVTRCVADLGTGTLTCGNYDCAVYGYGGGQFWSWKDCQPVGLVRRDP